MYGWKHHSEPVKFQSQRKKSLMQQGLLEKGRQVTFMEAKFRLTADFSKRELRVKRHYESGRK